MADRPFDNWNFRNDLNAVWVPERQPITPTILALDARLPRMSRPAITIWS